MIFLECNDSYFRNKIFALINQLSLDYFDSVKSHRSYFQITLQLYANNLRVSSAVGDDIKLQLPIRLNYIIECINKVSRNFKFKFEEFNYYPLNQELKIINQIVKLNLIHNKILMQLSINQDEGIEKNVLYKIIWPNDKTYQINKLDTHLSNLKNLINNASDFKINFESKNGIIRLVI